MGEGGGRGSQGEAGNGVRVRGSVGERQKGVMFLALKTEERVMSQEMWAASRNWKR